MVVCIKELKELPPLSSSAREILKIASNDDVDVSVFTNVVNRDPALLARIISLANSAYFGNRMVNDVHRAIVDVLGFRTSKNIALGLVLSGIFNPKHCQRFDLPKYWLLSLLTATLTRDFAILLNHPKLDANDAYLSGMLNEIGLMALAYLYPQEMDQVLLHEENEAIYESEKAIFGSSHYAISAQLLESWYLPEIVYKIMRHSDPDPDSDQVACDLCQFVLFSWSIAHKIYAQEETVELDELQLPHILGDHVEQVKAIISNASEQLESHREMANLLS
jgi:HD-like signal output (HDOD) protein